MKRSSLLTAFAQGIIRGTFLVPLLFGSLFAQTTQTGTITGRVYEESSGNALQGAVVTVRGTSASDYTDALGRFSISNVPAGATTLEIEYVGLDPFTQTVTGPAGASVNVTASM